MMSPSERAVRRVEPGFPDLVPSCGICRNMLRPLISRPHAPRANPLRALALRRLLGLVPLLVPLAACEVGPNFKKPTPPIAAQWLESGDPRVKADHQLYEQWWKAYNDPTLDHLVDLGYHQNLTLLSAGTRVLQARAQLGVAIGEFYPQTQTLTGTTTYNQASSADLEGRAPRLPDPRCGDGRLQAGRTRASWRGFVTAHVVLN